MNKFLHSLKTALSSFRLTDEEKSSGRAHLISFMGKNPVRVSAIQRLRLHMAHVAHNFISLTPKPMMFASIIFSIVALLSGVSYAANSALPGDFLYPVKVDFNEEVGSLFASSVEEKVQLEMQFMRLRGQEASTLQERGELDEEAQSDLAEEMAEHIEEIEEHLQALEAEGSDVHEFEEELGDLQEDFEDLSEELEEGLENELEENEAEDGAEEADETEDKDESKDEADQAQESDETEDTEDADEVNEPEDAKEEAELESEEQEEAESQDSEEAEEVDEPDEN